MDTLLKKAADILLNSTHTTAFTGAGISVESGIPPFRGPNGLWSKYDPRYLDIDYFLHNPEQSWRIIKEIFYDFFGKAKPNRAHYVLSHMEKQGLLQTIITQNIDHLHQEAGSKAVIEYHGTSHQLVCLQCGRIIAASPSLLTHLPPTCPHCGGLLKPDFVFFGEPIPAPAAERSLQEAQSASVWIIVGSTGEVMPAAMLPRLAKDNGAIIVEINISPSNYTHSITDIFLQGKATEVFDQLSNLLLLHNGKLK